MAKIIKKGNITQKIKNPYLYFNKMYNAVTSGKYDIRNLHWQNSTTTPGDTKDFAKDILKGKDTDKGVLIPWNKKMSDNLIGFHKHGIKFIGY